MAADDEDKPFKLGKEIRSEFQLEEGCTFVNHGSYGTVPKVVKQEAERLQREMEANPDRWFRDSLHKYYEDNINSLAKFVGADPKNLVFVENATTGVNTVMKNILFEAEDIILHNSHTYNACAKTVDCAARKSGADIMALDIILPIRSEDQLVDQIVEACKRHAGIRLVLIDHISSPSAILFPVERIIREMHKLGVLVLVDGAHAPGQLSLDLEKLDADFYIGNLHKWCYAPRGCAFLWVNRKHRSGMYPLITGHNYKKDFKLQFFNQGTRDHTSYLCTTAALNFYRKCGGLKGIEDYTRDLLDWAQQMLCHELGTSVLAIPPALQARNMRVLVLPPLNGFAVKREDAERFMTDIILKHNCVTCVNFFSGELYLRISANVYNVREDYIVLKDILMDHYIAKQ